MTLAEIIKKARQEAMLSQQKLAELCNMDTTTIAKIERGSYKKPSLSLLRKLSEALNLDGEVLVKAAGYVCKHAPDDNSFAAKVERARLNKLLSVSDLSKQCGLAYQTITKIETADKQRIQNSTYRILSDFLNLD